MIFYYWTDKEEQFFWGGEERWVGTLSLAKFYTDEQDAWENEPSMGDDYHLEKGTIHDILKKERVLICGGKK